MALMNHIGPIASTYEELQSLPKLREAGAHLVLRQASTLFVFRAAFQATEIALLNSTDLLQRAAIDITTGNVGAATAKLSWFYGFQRVLSEITLLIKQLGLEALVRGRNGSHLSIETSPTYPEFLDAVRSFDQSVITLAGSGQPALAAVISSQGLDNTTARLIHFARISYQEIAVWDRTLARVFVPTERMNYEELVCPDGIRHAFRELELSGDTVFLQFRGLHQIPELLGAAAVEQLRIATLTIKKGKLRRAENRLRLANLILPVIRGCLLPLVENLVPAEYQKIRENLGMTSGSHSAVLHARLLTRNYEELAQAVIAAQPQLDLSNRWDGVFAELCSLNGFVGAWRDLHLHLPRNNLGGGNTRSLVGSPDAVAAVQEMKSCSQDRDPVRRLFRDAGRPAENQSAVSSYLADVCSLDQIILKVTGEVIQARFPDVQGRKGFFSKRE